MVPPQHPRAHKTLADRQAMIVLINKYMRDNRNMNFDTLIPIDKRKIPKRWTLGGMSKCTYYSYGERCEHMEIRPNNPLMSRQDSAYATVKMPGWADAKNLSRFFSLATFYHGGIDEEYIWKSLPGIHQGCRDDDHVKKVVKAITRVNATMYTSMITKSIKPLVLHFLKNFHWTTPDANGRLPPFFDQKDRVDYFRECLRQQPWIVAWWLSRCVPYMLRLSFLYQSTPIEDTFQRNLQTNLLTLFEERFLLLADAAYLYLVDQDLTRSQPKWDEYKKEVLRVFKSLPTRPALVAITPSLTDLPIHVDISNRSRDIWLR